MTVCDQLIHWPLKARTTPASLSLYLGAMLNVVVRSCVGKRLFVVGRKTKRASRYTEASDEGAGSTRFLQLRQVMLSSKEKANSTQTNEGLQHDQRLRKWERRVRKGSVDLLASRGCQGSFILKAWICTTQ